jgi:hypothetical protein
VAIGELETAARQRQTTDQQYWGESRRAFL